MIYLQTEAGGKPRDFVIRVTREYLVHACAENPLDAIRDMLTDGNLKLCSADSTEMEIKEDDR